MQAVKAVGFHIMRKSAGATDARYGHRFLGRNLGFPADPVYRGQDSVVAATGAPAWFCAAIIFQCEISILDV
jgi:hypothetical protein